MVRLPKIRLRRQAILRLRRPSFDLRKAMFILPNLFTVASIFCGFYGAVTAAGANGEPGALYRACVAILFAAVFDSVDGRVARLTHTQSAFGVQMDSLADVVSFGAAPALIAWHWGLESFGGLGLFACFFFCACGAIRLARFNVMAAQASGPSHFFVGLPIPAGAWLLVAVIIAHTDAGAPALAGTEAWPPLLLAGLGLLMVSTIPFRTFKAGRMPPVAAIGLLGILGATVAVALLVRPSLAVVALMLGYLVFGMVEWVLRLFRPRKATPTTPAPPVETGEDELID